MLFNSLDYLVFLPMVVCLYFLTPDRFRWMLLLTASYFFYAAWRVDYLALIIISTVVDTRRRSPWGASRTDADGASGCC